MYRAKRPCDHVRRRRAADDREPRPSSDGRSEAPGGSMYRAKQRASEVRRADTPGDRGLCHYDAVRPRDLVNFQISVKFPDCYPDTEKISM